MTAWAVGVLVLAALAAHRLHRDLERADRRRRVRERGRANRRTAFEQYAELGQAFEELARQLGEQLAPHMRQLSRVVADLEAALERNTGPQR